MKIVVKLWSVIMFCIGICACSDDKMNEVRFSIDETNVNLSSGQLDDDEHKRSDGHGGR